MPETVTAGMLLAEMLALRAEMDRFSQGVEELRGLLTAMNAGTTAFNAAMSAKLAARDAAAKAGRMDR